MASASVVGRESFRPQGSVNPQGSLQRAPAVRLLLLLGGLLASHPIGTSAQDPPPVVRKLEGHSGAINGVGFLPDGWAATVSADETVRLWDVATGEEIRRYDGHRGPILSVAVSPDGRTLATGAQDNQIKIWDVPVPRPIRSRAGHDGKGTAFAVSPDGQLLVSVGQDKTVRLWRGATADPAGVRSEGGAGKTAVAFRGDGQEFVEGDEEGRLTFWAAAAEHPLGTLGGHAAAVRGLAYHPHQSTLVSFGAEGSAKLWQLPFVPPKSIVGQTAAVSSLTLFANGQQILTGGSDRLARLFDLQGRHVIRTFPATSAPITSVAGGANGSLVAAGDESGRIQLWTAQDGVPQAPLLGHVGPVRAVAFHPDSQRIASAGEDGSIRIWGVPPVAPQTLQGHQGPVRAVAASPTGQQVVTVSADKTVQFWNANGQSSRQYGGHQAEVLTAAYRADGGLVATGDAAGMVHVQSSDGGLQGILGADSGPVTAVAFHPTQQLFYTAGATGLLKQWLLPLSPARLVGGHPDSVRAVAVTFDGRFAFSSSNDGPIRVWDVSTGNPVRTLEGLTGPVNGIALSPDGNVIAGASETGGMQFWEWGEGRDVGRWLGSGQPATAMAYHPSGESIAVAGRDGVVRLSSRPTPPAELAVEDKSPGQVASVSRDGTRIAQGGMRDGKPAVLVREVATGKLLATLTGPESAVTAVAWNRDGTRLVAGAADNVVRVWNLAAPGPETTKLTGHSAAIAAVALSDDGATAYSTSAGESVIHQWDLATATETKRLSGHGGDVTTLLMLAESLASGSRDGTVRLWSTKTGETSATISHGAAVAALASSPDRTTLASGAADKTVKLWTAAGAPLRSLASLEGEVTGVAFSPDGARIVATDAAASRSWLVDGTPLDRLPIGNLVPRGIGYASDSRRIVIPLPDGSVRIADPGVTQAFVGHIGSVDAIAFSPDGMTLVTGGKEGEVRLWSVKTGQEQGRLTGAREPLTSLAVSRDGRVYGAALDRQVYEWTLAKPGGPTHSLTHPAPVRSLQLSADGQRLVTAGDDQAVVVWETATWRELERFRGHSGPITAVALAREGRTLVSGSQDRQVRFQTTSAQRIIAVAAADPKRGPAAASSRSPLWIQDLAMLPGSFRLLASVRGERSLRVWEPSGEPAPSLAMTGSVARFAVSAANRELITVDAEGRIEFRSLPDGQLLRTVETQAPLTNLTLNRDGTRLAVGDSLGQVRVYGLTGDVRLLEQVSAPAAVVDLAFAGDVQKPALLVGTVLPAPTFHTLALQRRIDAHAGAALGVAFNNVGDQLLSCGADGKVHAWRTNDGERLRTYAGGTDAMTCVSYSRDNVRVLAGGLDRQVRVWSAADGTLQATLTHPAAVRALSPSPDNTRVATAGDDHRVHVWDIAAGQNSGRGRELEAFDGHTEPTLGVAFAPDNRTVVSGSADQTIRLSTLAATRVVAAHEGAVLDFASSSGGGQFVTLGADGKARLWDTNLNPGRTFDGWEGEARALAVRADNQQLAIGLAAGEILLFSTHDGSRLRQFATNSPVTALAFSPDHQRLAATTEDRRLLVFETQEEGTLLQESPLPAIATKLAFASDGRRIWLTDEAGHLSEWGSAARREVRSLGGHGGAVYGLAFTGEGKTVVSCSADQTLRTWDVASGASPLQLHGHQGPVYGLARTPDSALVVSSSGDKSLRLWNLATGGQLALLPSGDQTSYSVALHPDGRTVAAAGADKKIRIVDLLSGGLLRTLEGHPDYIHRVLYSPSGKRLLSCGYSGRMLFWDADGTLLGQHRLPDAVTAAAYSPDGAQLVVGGSSGTGYVIDVPAPLR